MSKFIVLAALSLGLAQGQAAPTSEFIQRALQQGPDDRVQIFPAALPPKFTALPLPSGAKLLGSIVHGTEQATTNLYYTAPGSLGGVRQALKQALVKAGWTAYPQQRLGPQSTGGFQPSNDGPADFLNYYRLDQGLSLFVQLGQQSQQVALTYAISKPPQLALELKFRSDDPFGQLPALKSPPNVTVQPGGGGSSGSDVSQNARLLAPDLKLPALLDIYAAQLKAAGWTEFNRAVQPGVAQITFKVERNGVSSLGTLTLAQIAPGQYKGLLGLTALG